MKILNVSFKNFGSYADGSLEFPESSLALIHGPTGSGKSTIMDVVAWGLYGTTAKNGNVDEVRQWGCSAPTVVEMDLESVSGPLKIVRKRGGASNNDLFFVHDEKLIRGKDLNETQKMLNDRLGADANLYFTASYYHEFSNSASFFVNSAKARRELLESISYAGVAKTLSDKAGAAKKEAKALLKATESEFNTELGAYKQIYKNLKSYNEYSQEWENAHYQRLKTLKLSANNFEKEKASRIAAINTRLEAFEASTKSSVSKTLAYVAVVEKKLTEAASKKACPTCGNDSTKDLIGSLKTRHSDYLKQLESLEKAENPFIEHLAQAKTLENHYLTSLEDESKKTNPHTKGAMREENELKESKRRLDELTSAKNAAITRVKDLDKMQDISQSLRGRLLASSINQVQHITNNYIENYLGGEFRVEFIPDEFDGLDVSITKNGNQCYFTQLSKGQRQMLKLTFSLAVMKVSSNNSGVNFQNMFLDESLDGFDSELKVKAYSLFEALTKDRKNIFVIDHSPELKALFSDSYKVTLEGDYSKVDRE